MASLALPDSRLRSEVARVVLGRSRWELVEHAAMIVALFVWAVPFTRAVGGRGVHNELAFSAVMIVVLLMIRAWRVAPGSLWLAALTAVAALLVCVFAPTHWYGSDVAAGYVLSAAIFVAVRRYVRDEERRNLVAAMVCLAGLYQFAQAFEPWWGGRDSSVAMSGTFYWHNPYAAFLLPGAVVGLGLILQGRSPWSLVGWVGSPLCTAGVVFSSSRATMAALAVAVALLLCTAVRARSTALRFGGALLVAGAVVVLLPGPPLFPSYQAPWAATTARSEGGETISQNGVYRTQFWRSAIENAEHRPLVGTGYHALASASIFYTPIGWARSPLAHNGYLQALSDGGLLLGLPFLLGLLIAALWALRRLWGTVRTRAPDQPPPVAAAVAIAVLGAMAHSAVDFDWSHPAILVEFAILAACLFPQVRQHKTIKWWRALPFGALLIGLAILLPALHQWQIDQPDVGDSTATLLAHGGSAFGDFRPARTVLRVADDGSRSVTIAQVREALTQTAEEAKVDLGLALLRDAVGAKTGLMPDAVDDAVHEVASLDGSNAPWVPALFQVYVGAGRFADARRLLVSDISAQVAAGASTPTLTVDLALWAQKLGTGARYACQRHAVRPIVEPQSWRLLPHPTESCTQ